METKSAVVKAGRWIEGLIGGFIGGGANAVVASIVVPALSPHGDFKMMTDEWYKMVAAVFGASGVIGAMLYLKDHRTPGIFTEDTRTETETTVQRVGAPPVVTTVVETVQVKSATVPVPPAPPPTATVTKTDDLVD